MVEMLDKVPMRNKAVANRYQMDIIVISKNDILICKVVLLGLGLVDLVFIVSFAAVVICE